MKRWKLLHDLLNNFVEDRDPIRLNPSKLQLQRSNDLRSNFDKVSSSGIQFQAVTSSSNSPKPSAQRMDRPRWEAPQVRRRRQVRRQRRDRLVDVIARVVGELDRDRLRGALRRRPVQLLDGPFGFRALVEPDEADALGQTGDVVAQDARRDDLAVRLEQRLQVLLGHALGQARNVQVGALDGIGAGSRERHLDRLVLEPQPVKSIYCFFRVLWTVVVDEAVTQTLSCLKRVREKDRIRIILNCFYMENIFKKTVKNI